MIENRNRDECSGCPWWADSNDAVESRYFVSTLIGLLKVFLSLTSLLSLTLLSQLLSLSFCLHSHWSPQGGVLKIFIDGNQRLQVNGWQVCGTMDLTRLVFLIITCGPGLSSVVSGCHWLSFGWSLVVIGVHYCWSLVLVIGHHRILVVIGG